MSPTIVTTHMCDLADQALHIFSTKTITSKIKSAARPTVPGSLKSPIPR
jgi:hypothetical protein